MVGEPITLEIKYDSQGDYTYPNIDDQAPLPGPDTSKPIESKYFRHNVADNHHERTTEWIGKFSKHLYTGGMSNG
jgi:hypothetical protein